MKKRTILIIVLLVILAGAITLLIFNNSIFTGQVIERQIFHSSTIAICNDTNYCEDYKVECEGNKTIRTVATGFSIQHQEDWQDPRGEQSENLCD